MVKARDARVASVEEGMDATAAELFGSVLAAFLVGGGLTFVPCGMVSSVEDWLSKLGRLR